MFVAPWKPEASLAIPEIKTVPVWVTLKKIPNIFYSIVVSPDILLDVHNESNLVDPNTVAKVDNLIPLATISVLEDMYISITAQSASALTNIKETIESPVLESAQILPVIGTHIAHATSMVQRESSRIDEPTLVPTSLPH